MLITRGIDVTAGCRELARMQQVPEELQAGQQSATLPSNSQLAKMGEDALDSGKARRYGGS